MHEHVFSHLWHVHVVDEDDESLAGRRAVRVLGALLHVGLDVTLHVQRRRTAGEVHVQQQL